MGQAPQVTDRQAVALEWPFTAIVFLLLAPATMVWLTSMGSGWSGPDFFNAAASLELPLVVCAALWCTGRLGDWFSWIRSTTSGLACLLAIGIGVAGSISLGLAVDTTGTATSLPGPWWEIVILAPLAEELFFRGYLLWSAQRAFGPLSAVLISTLLFAAVHLPAGWIPTVAALLLGLGFSVQTTTTGSVTPAVLAHAAFNAVQWVFTSWRQ